MQTYLWVIKMRGEKTDIEQKKRLENHPCKVGKLQLMKDTKNAQRKFTNSDLRTIYQEEGNEERDGEREE